MVSVQPTSASKAVHVATRRWRAIALATLGAALLLPALVPAMAQDAPVRVRGAIERVDGAVYIVKSREGEELKLKLGAGAAVSSIVPAKLSDIAAGKYIGVTGMPLADGSQKAVEIHIFPDALRGLGEGFRAWDLAPETTMTNADVEATVSAADGRVLTLKYKEGQQRIVVPDGTPVVAFGPGAVEDLKPGAQIFVGSAKRLPDGTLETTRVSVGKGIAPPM